MWTVWRGTDDRVTDNTEDHDDDNPDHGRQCPHRATFDGAKVEAFGGRMSPFP
jgi:hypothetical protein